MSRIIRKEKQDRLPIVGKIKVGEKYIAPSGKESTRSLDHFIAVSDEEQYEKDFNKIYGNKPTSLGITFLSDDDKISCNERYELRVGKKLFAHGNGMEFYVHNEKEDSLLYEFVEDIDDSDELMTDILSRAKKGYRGEYPPKWEAILTLRFHLLEMGHILGAWEYSTKGHKSSIKAIKASYDLVKLSTGGKRLESGIITGGRVSGVPFDLNVKQVTSQKVGSKHKYPVVSLIANAGQDNLDKVRGFIEEGIELRGLLTNERIDEMSGVKQIEAPETFDLSKATAGIGSCKTIDGLNKLSRAIKEKIPLSTSPIDLSKLDSAYKNQYKKLTEIKNG